MAKTSIRTHIKELEKGKLLSRLAILAVTVALFILAGTFCLRTISTGWKLISISDNINFITETASKSPNGWTDELTEKYHKELEKRNNLINNEDSFVSFIAQSNNFIRFLTFIGVYILFLSLGYVSIKLMYCEIKVFQKYLNFKKHHKVHHS